MTYWLINLPFLLASGLVYCCCGSVTALSSSDAIIGGAGVMMVLTAGV
jgi:hypothetical protein